MANPLLKHDKLQLYKLHYRHILPLYENLSAENIREITVLYEQDVLEAMIDMLDHKCCHAVKLGDEVLAISGLRDGQFWIIFSKKIKKHWRSFVKASPKLMDFYQQFTDNLWCEVWDQNLFSQNWLLHLGFDPSCVIKYKNGQTVIHFVRGNYAHDRVDSAPSRPVMH
mgnify:CR=1 FL=1|jgi:hypothetical protein